MANGSECNCDIENLLEKSFGSRPYNEKEFIIKSERPMPTLNINTSTKKFVRHFHKKLYEDIKWLCGCMKMQKLFCWPCLLFSNEINVWNKHGFNDLNNLSKTSKRHESSKCHIDSYVKLKQFGNQCSVEFSTSEQYKISIENYNKKVTANRYILSKLIDVICFLSKQELTFRGVRESIESNGRDNYNFIDLVYLLSTSDSQLKVYLEKSTVFTGLSNTIQNDLIKSLGSVVLQEIKKEIEKAKFVAIIVDETADIGHKAQLSTVLRYMNENGKVEERFVGFTDANESREAISLITHVNTYLEEFQCSKKLVAQLYDSAAVMPGQLSGVQTKIKEISKHALFVHCYAHSLYLVLSQSVRCIKECKLFFQTLAVFASFFSKSTKRSHALDLEVKKRLHLATPVKWNYSSKIINYIMDYKQELKLVLSNMIECPEQWDSDTSIAARGLYHYLTDFDFQFLLIVFHQVFEQADILSDVLQKKNLDVASCVISVNRFVDFLRGNNFDLIWETIKENKNLTEAQPNKRMKLTIDGESEIESYKRLFHEIMDTLMKNFIDRFSDIKSLEFLSLLDVNKFKSYEKLFPEASFKCLTKFYGDCFDLPKLRSELLYLYSSPDYNGMSLLDIKNIIINDGLNKDVLNELYDLISLVFTIPSAAAFFERKF